MKSTQFTPGPWTVEGDSIFGNGSKAPIQVAVVHQPVRRDSGTSVYSAVGKTKQLANAALISAAPELLTALECVVARGLLHTNILSESEWDMVIKAVSKARGES